MGAPATAASTSPMRLWHRLFLACAGLSMLTLAGFAAWQQGAFSSGFATYLDRIALERARVAAPVLAKAYGERGDWAFLRRDPMMFGMLIDEHRRDAMAARRPPGPMSGDGPPRGPQGGPRPGPPFGNGLPFSGPPREEVDMSTPLVASAALDFGRRLRLLDTDGGYVAGNRGDASTLPGVPVELDGARIGTLEVTALPAHLRDSPEADFAGAQVQTALVAALAALLSAVALAWWLARWMLQPVRALADGTRALAAGDYARRVPSRGEDELAMLARDFNHLAGTLETHREARQRWGQDIAHELRTPLTILQAELQTLIDGVRPTDMKALQSLLGESERLSRLVDDLRQLALADSAGLAYRLEDLDLVELVESAVDTHRGGVRAQGLVLEVEVPEMPLHVRGDAARLAQLVDNLLLNARHYTDAPGRIVVRVSREGELACLVVEDTAPGVDAADLPRLFERLFRADRSRTRSSGGSGLGLAICAAIVEAHGGRIAAQASDLGGVRIEADFPIVETP